LCFHSAKLKKFIISPIFWIEPTSGLYVYNNKWELLQKRQKEYIVYDNLNTTINSPVIEQYYEPSSDFRFTVPETGYYDIYASIYFTLVGTATQIVTIWNFTTDSNISSSHGLYVENTNKTGHNHEVNCYNILLNTGDVIGIKVAASSYNGGGATASILYLSSTSMKFVKKD